MDKKVCKKFSQNLNSYQQRGAILLRLNIHIIWVEDNIYFISLLNQWTNILLKDDLEKFLLRPNKQITFFVISPLYDHKAMVWRDRESDLSR